MPCLECLFPSLLLVLFSGVSARGSVLLSGAFVLLYDVVSVPMNTDGCFLSSWVCFLFPPILSGSDREWLDWYLRSP